MNEQPFHGPLIQDNPERETYWNNHWARCPFCRQPIATKHYPMYQNKRVIEENKRKWLSSPESVRFTLVKCCRNLETKCDEKPAILVYCTRWETVKNKEKVKRKKDHSNLMCSLSLGCLMFGGSLVERRSLIGELSLVCTGPAADG